MSELNTRITRASAIELIQAIIAATGEKSYRAARDQVRNALLSAWPELLDPSMETTESEEARHVKFTDKQLRAMGEGFLSLLSAPNSNGSDMIIVKRMAAALSISKWLDHKLGTDETPDLDFPLDDEPQIGD